MPPADEKGFTLIQLVLALLVIGILGAVLSVDFGGLADITLSNAEKKFVSDLRYAQQLAITTGVRHGLRVDAGMTEYNLYRDDGAETAIKDPMNLGQDFIVNFGTYQQDQLAGVQFASAAPFCGTPEVEFNGSGAPTDDGGILIACTPSVVLTRSGKTETVTIEQNTGQLSY